MIIAPASPHTFTSDCGHDRCHYARRPVYVQCAPTPLRPELCSTTGEPDRWAHWAEQRRQGLDTPPSVGVQRARDIERRASAAAFTAGVNRSDRPVVAMVPW